MIGTSAQTNCKTLTDAEIITRIQNGQLALYEIMIRRNNPYLYRIGRAYGFNHEDTEDLMQETYLNVYGNLEKFEGRASFKTWITKVMLHNCFQRKKKFSFRNEIPTEMPAQNILQAEFMKQAPSAEQMLFSKELSQIVEKALNHIPISYRMVFTLRELNGLTVEETSEALKISKENVKVRLNRAKKMLRAEIEKMFSPSEIFEFNLIYCDRMVERVMSKIR